MNMHETASSAIKKSGLLALFFVSIATALLLGELFERLIVNPGDFLMVSPISDPVLGFRIKPYTTGHDALGFRNVEVPERANVVAIGDSLTYGVSAPRDGSWPHQLGDLLHEQVYNMGLGGYGPLQYLYLATHQAKQLHARQLIVGFFFGNDLIDAYRLAHHTAYWKDWRGQGSPDGSESVEAEERELANTEPQKHLAGLRDWLSRHSVLYSMSRIVFFPWLANWEKDSLASQANPDQQMIWADPSKNSVRTIFTPLTRLDALDTRRVMVNEGLQITKRAFASLQKEADAQGASLLIVLTPTKERVYCRYLKESGTRIPDAYARLCDSEEQVKQELMRFFNAEKIAYVDVTGAMEKQTYRHVQMYPKDSDGHPLAAGYGVIANAVYDAIRARQHGTQNDRHPGPLPRPSPDSRNKL